MEFAAIVFLSNASLSPTVTEINGNLLWVRLDQIKQIGTTTKHFILISFIMKMVKIRISISITLRTLRIIKFSWVGLIHRNYIQQEDAWQKCLEK